MTRTWWCLAIMASLLTLSACARDPGLDEAAETGPEAHTEVWTEGDKTPYHDQGDAEMQTRPEDASGRAEGTGETPAEPAH